MEISKFDAIQTFYVDSAAVNGSSEVYLTSIELYLKKKPSQNVSNAAIYKPGIVVSICEVENDMPLLNRVYSDSLVRLDYDNIYAFEDASVSTSFVFKKPLQVRTNKFYGIVVQYDDAGFELWANKQGDAIIGTNIPSPGINSTKDGKFYNGVVNSTTNINPHSDIDLKYKVNIAKFTSNNVTVELVNKDYEFLTINSISDAFVTGEYVYQNVANSTGNITVMLGNNQIKGTNTDFTTLHSGDKIVVLSSNDELSGTVLTVATVVNSTLLETASKPLFSNTSTKYKSGVVGKVYNFDPVNKKMILFDSTANSSMVLSSNSVLVGTFSKSTATVQSVDNFSVDRIMPMVNVLSPSIGTYTGDFNFSYSNGVTFLVDSSKKKPLFTETINVIDKYDAYVLSRSNEVLNSNLHDSVARKSAVSTITFNINSNTENLFTSPFIDEEEIDFFIQQSNVTSVHTQTIDGVEYDTEVGKNGLATSKAIEKKITFANNRFAEDIIVFADIYRPVDTDVKIYAKLHNSSDSEAFDDKSWTPLEMTQNKNKFSSTENRKDYIEYWFELPKYPETANTVPGSFTVSSGNAVVVGSTSGVNNYVTTGDVVRVYNPLESNTNYFIAGVIASNSSSITLNTTTANASVLGLGLKIDKVKYKNIAFKNPQNDEVCSYFNNNLAQIDKFNTMQIKIVFTANNSYFVPRVNSISVVGASA